MNDNFILAGARGYKIAGFYFTTGDDRIARIYFDAMCIVEAGGRAGNSMFLAVECLVCLKKFAAEKGIRDDDAALCAIRASFMQIKDRCRDETYDPERDDKIILRALNGVRELDKAHSWTPDTNLRKGGKEFPQPDPHLKIDFSVGTGTDPRTAAIPFDELKGRAALVHPVPGCGTVKILRLDETHIDLKWNGRDFSLDLGGEGAGASAAGDRAISFRYCDYASFDGIMTLLGLVGDRHRREDKTCYPETTGMEERLLFHLDRLIGAGDTELYVLRALLSASNNWSTFAIVRKEQFRGLLLEGIGRGCLAPDRKYDWSILGAAAMSNDPEEFMTDKERYYDLLATAAEAGIGAARDIMNRIREPERIIEED